MDSSDDSLGNHLDDLSGIWQPYTSLALSPFNVIFLSHLTHLHKKTADFRYAIHSSTISLLPEYLQYIYDDFKILVDIVEISEQPVAKVVREGMEAVKMDIEELLIILERCLLEEDEWKKAQGFEVRAGKKKQKKGRSWSHVEN